MTTLGPSKKYVLIIKTASYLTIICFYTLTRASPTYGKKEFSSKG